MILRNVSPLGDLYVTGCGFVEAGARFAVRPADVAGLIGQAENFKPDDDEAREARAAYDAPAVDEPTPASAPDDTAAPVSLNKNETH